MPVEMHANSNAPDPIGKCLHVCIFFAWEGAKKGALLDMFRRWPSHPTDSSSYRCEIRSNLIPRMSIMHAQHPCAALSCMGWYWLGDFEVWEVLGSTVRAADGSGHHEKRCDFQGKGAPCETATVMSRAF
jgi:hypothetical protein